MKATSKTKVLVALIIAVTAFIISIGLNSLGGLDFIEMKTFDLRLQLSKKGTTANDDVVIILIDEASLQSMKNLVGRWPWPRALFGELTEFLAEAGAKSVLYDILFTEPQIPRNEKGELGDNDAFLAAATASTGFVIHAAQFVHDSEDKSNKTLLNRPLPKDFLDRFTIKNVIDDDKYELQKLNNFYLPLPELYQNAMDIGLVEFAPDSDGIYRRTHLLRQYGETYFPVLSTAVINQIKKPHRFAFHDGGLLLDSFRIPLQPNGTYMINMKQKFTTFSIGGIFASMQQLQMGETENLLVSPEEFRDKIILVGASAAGVEDLKHTSLGSDVPGVMLHGSIIANILDKDFIQNVPPELAHLLTLLISLMIAGIILGSHRVSLQVGIPGVLAAAFLLLAFELFDRSRLWLPIAMPLLAWGLSFFSSFAYVSVTEGKEKRRTRKMLSQYVSPAVLAEVMDKPNAVLTAEVGAKEELTILFSDIRGFTTFSEKNSPELVVEMLNFYLREMIEIVFEYKGTLDKFIGDAVMAFWGAPIRAEDHARKAVLAALKMGEKLDEINRSFKEKNYPEFKIGIGLNTGHVILGNIGSEKKLDYTVIGDNVNLASRMEGLTKSYSCDILFSESTFNQLGGDIPSRVVDAVRVKGKKLPIKIYSPVSHPDSSEKVANEAKQVVTLTEKAFHLYQSQKWNESIATYRELLQINPEDNLSRIFIERCEEYLQEPPPADWDGCYTMKTK